MLKRFSAMILVFSFASLLASGCDSNSAAPAGTGGTIGGGTGGAPGTGGSTGTGGGTTGTGGSNTGTGGAGGGLTPAQQNDAIINAPPAANVDVRDLTITGTPLTYANGVCQ